MLSMVAMVNQPSHMCVCLRLGADEVRCLVEMYGQAREFFGLPQYFKDSVCPYRPSLEIGYSHVRHLAKEFFAVRTRTHGTHDTRHTTRHGARHATYASAL